MNVDRNHFGIYNGCLYDKNNIYILLEKGSEYESLSDGVVYNKLRNLNSTSKLGILISLTEPVRQLHQAGYSHNMISPDSFLINFEQMTVKLIHFENCISEGRHIKNMESLVGTIIVEPEETNQFVQAKPNNKKSVNNDLYALVKTMLHLDDNFYAGRYDEFGNERFNKIDHASYDSIVELYQNNNYPTPEILLEFVHSKCEEVKSQDNSITSYLVSSITKLSQFVIGQSEEKTFDCKGLTKIYKDILSINSLTFIENADELMKRLDTMHKYYKAIKSTISIGLFNSGQQPVILTRSMTIKI